MRGLFDLLSRPKTAGATKPFDLCLNGNPNGRNILIFTEYVNATYFISFDLPLREMHRRKEVNFAVISQNLVTRAEEGFWKLSSEAFKPDLVIITRYGQPFGAQIVDYFKAKKIPTIYHIDDNLLEIPASLGVEVLERQGAQDIIDARRYLLAHCDLIYASTSHLAGLLIQLFPDRPVYHGMYAPYIGDRLPITRKARPYQTVGYMGSKGHQEDLNLVVPALERLLDERPDLHFEVFGTIQMPPRLERFGDRIKSHKVNKAYSEFLSVLASLNWDIGLAPLVNEEFNLCKAPTKFIEYTAAGIPVIASNIPVYSKVIPSDGGMLVDETGWYDALVSSLDSKDFRTQAVRIAQEFCAVNFSIDRLEQQLALVFDKVTIP
ncbi:glycosyltransferase [Pseudomonas sp. R3-56]|uniref:glycosyltransferase n=1 Tax=Pseudomonas sp. R3-56 TaxID=2817401 RepID=UPI003DA96285